MLGWEIFVFQVADNSSSIANWKTGVFGLRWIDELVTVGNAIDLEGNGYPNRYSIAAGVLLPIIQAGLPSNDSPLIIGDDYILSKGWNGELFLEKLANYPADEILIIEAWDQS